MKTSTDKLSFSQKENRCELTFSNSGPFWHLCTPGNLTEILCENDKDYRFLVSLIGIVAAITGISVIAFAVMSNHIHLILNGPEEKCRQFFSIYTDKLRYYYKRTQRYKNISALTYDLIPITSLAMLRTEIAYVNRNGYVALDGYTPFSYPWSSGILYFNYCAEMMSGTPYQSLSYTEKRELCGGRLIDLPENYEVIEGQLSPRSFCSYKFGEAFFRNAHHYFSLLTKNSEAYAEVAKRLGDTIILSDDEMFATLTHLCQREYSETRPSMLPNETKLEVAKRMRRDYNATSGQIQRMLRLDANIVSSLFGKSPLGV
jgi:REP element-mobilizing transposase RayT